MEKRWTPRVTVAAVLERDGRFLLVEERQSRGLVLNNPAGHLDIGESLPQACVREVLEDTTAPCCDWEAPAPFSGEEFLPGLEGPEGLPLVTEALLRRGWAEAEILGVLGGNVASLFRAELGRTARERG